MSLAKRCYSRLNKPEYWFQPWQIGSRIRLLFDRSSRDELIQVRVPWGVTLQVRAQETLGRSLRAYGVYDLVVSEVLWRLTDPGDWCVDVGANIGYMTGLLSVKSEPTGRVFSFEPHPKLFARLETNVRQGLVHLRTGTHANVTLRQRAVGAADGQMDLVEPPGFDQNEGVASLTTNASVLDGSSIRYRVEVRQLDGEFAASEKIGVMKIDVEGGELSVLQGAARLLVERKIRDIVFEDFHDYPSESALLLERAGYSLRRIGKAIRGPVTWHPRDAVAGEQALRWEPVNYLATLDLKRAENRLRPRGWQCLRVGR